MNYVLEPHRIRKEHMPEHHVKKINSCSPGKINASVSTGKIEKNAQLTTADTGWSEEEKERMKAHGYDSLDMVRAWYS